MSDADTTIYLFGTIHMLQPGTTWRSPVVDKALAGSRAVYFEADVEGDPSPQAAMIQRLGLLPPEQHLSDLLNTSQALALSAAAARLGYSRDALERLQPWFAAVTLSDAAIRAAGYSADAGTETTLRRQAEAGHKEVRFLETMETQLAVLANLPRDAQLSYLALSIADIDNVGADLAAMVGAWRSGDLDALVHLLIDDDMARLPALREALLTQRNAAWSDQLRELLDREPGQFLVAVGAAHLVGAGSVQEQLAALGLNATRVQ